MAQMIKAIVAGPLGSCPLHIRGGHAVPLQRPALTSRAGTFSRHFCRSTVHLSLSLIAAPAHAVMFC